MPAPTFQTTGFQNRKSTQMSLFFLPYAHSASSAKCSFLILAGSVYTKASRSFYLLSQCKRHSASGTVQAAQCHFQTKCFLVIHTGSVYTKALCSFNLLSQCKRRSASGAVPFSNQCFIKSHTGSVYTKASRSFYFPVTVQAAQCHFQRAVGGGCGPHELRVPQR